MYIGLLDLSKIKNSIIASQIKKGVRDQKVVVSCSLPMPVEPTSANFRKFEVDNKHIHLNVYGTLGDEARSPVTHHCMSATTKTSVPRQSTSYSQGMRKGKGTLQLHQEHVSPHAQHNKESQEEASVSSLC